MNTMELVHMMERAEPRNLSPRRPTPPFPSELIGRARQAILRARLHLINAQQEDGCWIGVRRGNAALSSQLIFWLTYRGEEQSPQAEAAAAAILDAQLPSGGWPIVPNGRPDGSTSVQAYFALKLVGFDPAEERLRRARKLIRGLGGADAADATTRYFLALLGQVDYDCCPVAPPELLPCVGRSPSGRAALSVVWSHRPVRDVGIERGVRELFIERPCDWPRSPALPGSPRSRFSEPFRVLLDSILRRLERRGWTPLRGRGLEQVEKWLVESTQPERLERLKFTDLLWHAIAVQTAGHGDDSAIRRTCDERLRELMTADGDPVAPRVGTAPFGDTIMVLRALRASGVEDAHPVVCRGWRWLSSPARRDASLSSTDLANLVFSVAPICDQGSEANAPLPPAIDVSRDRSASDSTRRTRPRRLALLMAEALERLQQRLRAADVDTGEILEAIAVLDNEDEFMAFGSAADYLVDAQCADGGWDHLAGGRRIEATSQGIRGLVAADAARHAAAIRRGVQWLIVEQQASGGWGEADGAAEPARLHPACDEESQLETGATASHTAYALAALVAAGEAHRPSARRAVQFLLETQEDDGRWHEPHFVYCDDASGSWFGNDLRSVAWPLLAVSRWLVASMAARQDTADSMALRLVTGPAENYD